MAFYRDNEGFMEFNRPESTMILYDVKECMLYASITVLVGSKAERKCAIGPNRGHMQLFAKEEGDLGFVITNHTSSPICFFVTRNGKAMNHINAVHPKQSYHYHSDCTQGDRQLVISQNAEKKTVQAVFEESPASPDITMLEIRVMPLQPRDFGGAEWMTAPISVRVPSRPHYVVINEAADSEEENEMPRIGSAAVASMVARMAMDGSSLPVARRSAMSGLREKGVGDRAVAAHVGVSNNVVREQSSSMEGVPNAEKACSFTLMLSVWAGLEITPPSAQDISESYGQLLKKVYTSATDVVTLEGAPDCVFYNCGHEVTTMDSAKNLSNCPMCRRKIFARIPSEKVQTVRVQI